MDNDSHNTIVLRPGELSRGFSTKTLISSIAYRKQSARTLPCKSPYVNTSVKLTITFKFVG